MGNIAQNKMMACQFDYEYMGRSIPALAQTYGYPESLIEDQVNKGNWSRKLDELIIPDSNDLEEFADKLREVTKAKLNVVALMGQLENQAMVNQLEKVCLQKALELASDLDSNDVKAPGMLKTIVSTLNSLQDRNPVNLADNIKDLGADTGKLIVQINNTV